MTEINHNEYQKKAFALLHEFANQRPGLDPACYCDGTENGWRTYRREAASITRDLHNFRDIYTASHWRSFSPDAIREAFRSAFSGRITLHEGADGMPERLSYCAGQYFPTEYRKAACAVLASLLWDHARQAMPDDPQPHAGGWLRAKFRKEFRPAICRGYFS